MARWRAKTDPSDPPPNPRDIQPITPSEIFGWIGPGNIPRGGARVAQETHWFAMTGRLVSVQAESDGDIHMVLANAYDDQPGQVIAEIPLGDKWCRMRTTVFSWTNAVFPFNANFRESPFRLVQSHIVTVIGKAFYDTDHSGKDIRNNRRPRAKEKAVWEIHPVMRLEVNDAVAPPAPPAAPASPPAQVVAPISPRPTIAPTSPPALAQLVTVLGAVRIKIPYGETVIPAGSRVPLVSRTATTVTVRYLGQNQTIPLSSTDLR